MKANALGELETRPPRAGRPGANCHAIVHRGRGRLGLATVHRAIARSAARRAARSPSRGVSGISGGGGARWVSGRRGDLRAGRGCAAVRGSRWTGSGGGVVAGGRVRVRETEATYELSGVAVGRAAVERRLGGRASMFGWRRNPGTTMVGWRIDLGGRLAWEA